MTKIIYYRNKCIGCGICYEQQPERWRMSKKDGKASLLESIAKKDVFVLLISDSVKQHAQGLTEVCPVNIIKVL